MSIDIVRAWKDKNYRESLSEEARARLPENPAGLIELSDEELGAAGRAEAPEHTWHAGTLGCNCGPFPTMGYTCIGFTECGALCDTAWCTLGAAGAAQGDVSPNC